MRGANEYKNNQSNKRGLVIERDPAKHRVKVQFPDEDESVTHWIDVVANASTGTSFFAMPGMGDEVWCALDHKGEDGCLIGSKYNDKDKTPFSSNDIVGLAGAWGSFHINIATGDFGISTGGTVSITASDIALESGTLTHNGVNIGHTHTHPGIEPGPDNTDPPE